MNPNPFNTDQLASNPYNNPEYAKKPIEQPLIVYPEGSEDIAPPPANNFQIQNKEPGPLDHLNDGLQGQTRSAFIGKVYILFTIELAITFGICLISQYVEAYRNFQINNWWVVFFPILLIIVIVIVVCCVPKSRQAPYDLLMLLAFVLCFSYVMSFVSSIVVESVDGPVIPLAIGATVGITLLLTIYAFCCKGHYVIWLGILIVLVPVAIVLGLMLWVFYFKALIIVFAVIAIIIFGIYLVVITKMIIGGQFQGFPLDTPILASLFLYIYTMRIFLYILLIFAAGGGKK